MVIGYTTGVFDLFHIGHLNILKKAKEKCDYLIVGVTTDDFVLNYKNKKPVIPFENRIEIIKSIKYVDEAIPQVDHNKFKHWNKLKFDLMFVGDDWKGTEKWKKYEDEFNKINVKIIYLPRTENISSTEIVKSIENK